MFLWLAALKIMIMVNRIKDNKNTEVVMQLILESLGRRIGSIARSSWLMTMKGSCSCRNKHIQINNCPKCKHLVERIRRIGSNKRAPTRRKVGSKMKSMM